jgi:hypothetical protein
MAGKPTLNGLNLNALRCEVVAGANSATSIAVADIATEDTIVAVIYEASDQITTANYESQASVTSAGNIQLSTNSTASGKLTVWWYDKSVAEA